MTAVRVFLMIIGIAVGAYGVMLVMDNTTEVIIRIVTWALIGVLLHDAVFAPVCVALGFAGRRVLPHKWWTPVLVAALTTVVLVLLAIPVFDKPGQHLDNPSVLDRNYEAGFWIALGVVWGAALLYLVGDRVLPVRQDEVVESQGADHVEAQPPSLSPDGKQGAGGSEPDLER
ncbi:hypothetical protein FHT40_004934 [Mycolicibacterium sp. BK556]|nr:hypothetical protein [Mycolicibacterium sp. BK556]MBB3635446.1 hypothetical protein [Mycolicibacterium sp. BK607]MBB3747760.1 hypothetical protein [Mycolicibacterium sp. BK634]TDO08104.1 hypothetical protein EV580_5675 [Mycobacterium sp. BK086]